MDTRKLTVTSFVISLFVFLQFSCKDNVKKESATVNIPQPDSAKASVVNTNAEALALPDSISAFLSNDATASMKKLAAAKPGDTLFVEYARCLLADGRPAMFCIKAPEESWGGWATKDPQFSWNVDGEGGWAHADNLTYLTATQGVWETDCHAEKTRNGSIVYFSMWLENGTPGNAHHKGATPKFRDKFGDVWMVGERVLYQMNSGKHLSTMLLIKTTL